MMLGKSLQHFLCSIEISNEPRLVNILAKFLNNKLKQYNVEYLSMDGCMTKISIKDIETSIKKSFELKKEQRYHIRTEKEVAKLLPEIPENVKSMFFVTHKLGFHAKGFL